MLLRPLQKNPDFSGWESAYKLSKSVSLIYNKELFIDSTQKICEPIKKNEMSFACSVIQMNEL